MGTDVAATGAGEEEEEEKKKEREREREDRGGCGGFRRRGEEWELEASRRIMYNIIFYDISFWGALGYR